jgi:ribosomal protein L29
MPDTSVAQPGDDPYDPSVEERVSRLEEGMQDVKSAVGQLQATTSRLEATSIAQSERLGRVEIGIAEIKALLVATLPHLATKADLAELRLSTTADITELRESTKADIAELRESTKADMAELRESTKADITELRESTTAEMAALRLSTAADSTELRASTKSAITELRESTKADNAALRLSMEVGIANLRTDMVTGFADKPSKTYMWGVLAVLLTAYACGLAALAILK